MDLISRQAAIDEIKALYEWHDTVTEDRVIDHLMRLPSAQPEIIRCKECSKYIEGIDINGEPFTRCKVSFDKGGKVTYGQSLPDWFWANAERKTDE